MSRAAAPAEEELAQAMHHAVRATNARAPPSARSRPRLKAMGHQAVRK